MWLESSGQMKLKDIAAALFVPDSRVRKWKTLDNWDADLKGSVPRRGALSWDEYQGIYRRNVGDGTQPFINYTGFTIYNLLSESNRSVNWYAWA